MRYKYIGLSSLVLVVAFMLNGCGPVDNFQNQRQVNLQNLALGGDFRIDNFDPNYNGSQPPTNINYTSTIQATFNQNCVTGGQPGSIEDSFRVTQTTSDGQVTDLTNNTSVSCSGRYATFNIGTSLAMNSRIELTIYQTAMSAQGENLKYLNIYKMYTGYNFDAAGNAGFTDPANPPEVIDVNYYEICGQPYMFIFFSEDLVRGPRVRVKTGVIGTAISLGDPTYSTWPAYSGRMDVFGVHINSGGALSGHSIKIFKNDVVDLQGDTMENDYSKSGLFQLFSPC